MENLQHNEDILWQIAKRRAGFKTGFTIYIAVNVVLVTVWYFYSGLGSYFWPLWPILGWGIGIVTQYIGAYHSTQIFSAEKEYERLKQVNEISK